MSASFTGKVAVVTGGGSGIGRTTALLFAKNGARVVVANRSAAPGEATVKLIKDAGGDAIFVSTDVTKSASVEALMKKAVERYGRLDCVFASAGAHPAPGVTTDETEEQWDLSIDVNLKGSWLCTKFAIPHMLKNGGGSIVNVAGITGLVGFSNWASQCASKHGVVGLTKAVALEYAKAGIRANVVCPGLIRTPMLEKLAGGAGNVDGMAGLEPIGRVGRPEDIAEAVLFLSSEEAGFITGHALSVDGGWVAQ